MKLSQIKNQVYALATNIKPKEYFVYQLVCPMDGKIKWIGITGCLFYRLSTHYYNKDYGHPNKWEWIAQLKLINLLPKIELLGRFMNKKEALNFEKEMIIKNAEVIFNWPKKRGEIPIIE